MRKRRIQIRGITIEDDQGSIGFLTNQAPFNHPTYALKFHKEDRWRLLNFLYGDKLEEYVKEGLEIDGAQHKQWYLYQIADLLNLNISEDLDPGVEP